MSKPTFELFLDTFSLNSRIHCNGIDITNSVNSVFISQKVGEIVKLELGIVPGQSIVHVKAALDVQITDDNLLQSFDSSPTEIKETKFDY